MSLLRGYRQLVLFLIALVLPSVALVVLGLRIIDQERELSEKRVIDQQRQTANEIGHQLLTRLERIKLEELSAFRRWGQRAGDASVVFAGWARNGQLSTVWDASSEAGQFRADIRQHSFNSAIEEGERAEFAEKAYDRAIALYTDALNGASNNNQAVFARSLLARVLRTAGRSTEAEKLDLQLLALAAEIVDEYGIPFAFQSALRLVKAGITQEAPILERVREETEFFLSRTPAQVSTLRQVVEALEQSSELIIQREAAALDRTLQVHAQRLERIRSLQADFPMLRLDPSTWQIYGDGDNAWLVSMSPRQPNAASMVIAIDSASVFSTVKTENPFPWKIRIRDGNSGESLGEALPGLSVSFDAIESRGTRSVELYRMYYLLSLGLVLAVTALGGYLVWRDMRRELKVAEMRSQFVSSVSHELKTPLTAIRMFVDTLRFRKPEDTKTQEQCLETISQESERLTRLVDNVLDFSRIERGQKTYQLQPVSLASVITSSTRAVQYGLTQEGFRLRVSLPDTLPPIFADRDAVEQAILNLLTNAMKYSGDSRDIDIDVRVEASAALIRVSDRGIGIPVHEQSRIFEKFYRATTPENRGIPGTGLGLALVVHIARAHGGTIAVESIPGQGSTFTLRLPLVTAAGASGGNHL